MNEQQLDKLIEEALKLPKMERLHFLRANSGYMTFDTLMERIGKRLIETLSVTEKNGAGE